MADFDEQNKANHVRYHPPFHFFFSPAILLLFLISIYGAIRYPGFMSFSQVLLVLLVGEAGFLARIYALKVQDRVIRLEEQIRLSSLMGDDYLPVIRALSEPQLIALRFASDEEVPALARRAAREKLTVEAIKAEIKRWRADYWRV